MEQYFCFHSLCSLQGCPFQLEVFTKQSDHEVSAVDVSGVNKELEQALHESISMISKKTLIKNKKDLILHVAEFDQRISLAIENQVNSLFLYYRKFQKQPPEVFCKKVSLEISQIHRKTPVSEPLF